MKNLKNKNILHQICDTEELIQNLYSESRTGIIHKQITWLTHAQNEDHEREK